jgi:AcrB/AcrD/AcrF family
MIGFMASAGIVVRNSIILVDFIEQRVREGVSLDAAVVDAGAVRFRPMFITAMAVIVGGAVILFDPIFQGLAISLMAGEIASLLISRMAVPVLYFMAYGRTSQGPTPALRDQPIGINPRKLSSSGSSRRNATTPLPAITSIHRSLRAARTKSPSIPTVICR